MLAELVGKLYGALEAGGLLGRHFRYRSQVLRAVFRLVDREHGALLANIARVMLAVSPRGKGLGKIKFVGFCRSLSLKGKVCCVV